MKHSGGFCLLPSVHVLDFLTNDIRLILIGLLLFRLAMKRPSAHSLHELQLLPQRPIPRHTIEPGSADEQTGVLNGLQ
ncbi:hypothetical protein GCM10028803_51560 [Larkinella knui]